MNIQAFPAKIQAAFAIAAAKEAAFGAAPGGFRPGDLVQFTTPPRSRATRRAAGLVSWLYVADCDGGHLMAPVDERSYWASPVDVLLKEDVDGPHEACVRTTQCVVLSTETLQEGSRIWTLPESAVLAVKARIEALSTGQPVELLEPLDDDEAIDKAEKDVEAFRLHLERLDKRR